MCPFPIKPACDLLQCWPFGFHEQEPYTEAFDDQNDNVDEVVFPGQMGQADRVDVLVQHTGQCGEGEAQGKTLSADVVGQDLGAVGYRQTRPGEASASESVSRGNQCGFWGSKRTYTK